LYHFPNPYIVNPYYQSGIRSAPFPYVPAPYYDYQHPWNIHFPRQFPPVDVQQLEISVQRFHQLIQQADMLINRLANSKEFATELMSAAQKSDKNKVNQLIRSTGVSIDIKTTFTPTGIRIVLDNSKIEGDCCNLLIALRW